MRRRSRSFIRVRQPISTSYIQTAAPITLAAGVATPYSMLLTADSPTKTNITDFSAGIAQSENNTRLMKGSFVQINLLPTTAPAMVGIWVWMNTKGQLTTPTDSLDFSQAPAVEDNTQLREKTIAYRQVPTSTSEFRSIRIKLAGRRNNFMPDATILVMMIHNMSATASLSFSAFGRIRTLEG